MTAAIYARYSTDKQADTSIDDQVRVCRAAAERLSLSVGVVHGDDGISGSTPVMQRPGGRALMADALAGRVGTVILESLDRLSRDQVDLERTVRRLEHLNIRLVGVSDGYDSLAAGRKVIRAVRGIVSELYLDDLRAKTHRGLSGQFGRGYVAGGKSYGYRIVRTEAGSQYEIDEDQARWVLRIFERYAAGEGVQRIAHDLNTAGAPSPRGGTWAVSAIYGSPLKGAGILNNELYIGRYIWNRSQWLKDPDTGRRQRVDRPRHEWMEADVPHLRIVPDELWQAVRARIDDGRDATGHKRQYRPARTLFGGLMQCPHCAAPMIAISATRYGCNARKDRGPSVCAGFSISRDLVDKRMLSLVRDELLSDEAAAEFERACKAMLAERAGSSRTAKARAAELEAEIGRLVDAIARAGGSDALLSRLRAAEDERKRLAAERPATLPPVRETLHKMLLDLQAALQRDSERARAILSELIGPVALRLDGEQVWAEMQTGRALERAAGQSITVVAGARYDRCRSFRLK